MPTIKKSELFNDKGVYFYAGMGCLRYDNCFNCPYPDCRFQETHSDMKCYSRRGTGIDCKINYSVIK